MVKRSNIKLQSEINQELDYILTQLLHKDEAALKIKFVNRTVSAKDFELVSEAQGMFNEADSKLYLRVNNKLFSFTGTEI